MKAHLAFALLVAGSCTGVLAAGNGVAPVGFIKLSIAGSAKTLVSPSFVSPGAWSGSLTGVLGTQLSATGAGWTPSQFAGAYYVEITSGDYAGLWTDVVANEAGTLTTNDDLSSFIAAGTKVVIRKFVTLQDFLGTDNRAGLKSAASLAGADEVVVYKGSVSKIYWYYDGTQGGTAGWYDSQFQPAGTVIIPPGQGVVIQRKAASPLSLVAAGAVKRGPTYVAVQSANNVVDSLSPAGLELRNSNLFTGDAATGVRAGRSLATADEVVLYPATTPRVFWRYDGSQGGAPGWYDASYQPADNVEIPAGASFAIQRKNSGDSFFWVAPSLVP
jgi:uncharacterized protein (TIGR02597 family)